MQNDSNTEYNFDEIHIDSKFQEYVDEIHRYEGYFVDPAKVVTNIGGICPISNHESVDKAANFAVDKHGKDKGIDLSLERIVRCNYQIVAGFLYFITLQASDELFYEAKVYLPPGRSDFELDDFRLARYYPNLPAKE